MKTLELSSFFEKLNIVDFGIDASINHIYLLF